MNGNDERKVKYNRYEVPEVSRNAGFTLLNQKREKKKEGSDLL
jgi:hypothetical protein